MQAFFAFLQKNPYLLLFLVVGLAVWIGRVNVKGYGLGMVAGAIVIGCGISVWGSAYGAKLELNNFAKSLFYYLFMYGVGLRVGPSFINSLGGDGLKFTLLAVVSAFLGLGLSVAGAVLFDLPAGAAGGILAGSQTMSAAIGSAEQAVSVIKLPPGTTPEAVSAMIALSYGITYIWGTVGIILIVKYLPKWWGIDAKAAAKKYEEEFGVNNVEGAGLSGFRPFGLRAYKLENASTAGQSIEAFRSAHPEYRIVNVVRNNESVGADPATVLQKGDIVALGGKIESLTDKMGLIGPEVADQKALNIPLDQAEILVTNKEVVDRELVSFRDAPFAGQLQLVKFERSGVPFPVGLKTKLQRRDILTVVGLAGAVQEAGKFVRTHCASEHRHRPADSVGGHDPRVPDRPHPVPGLRCECRPGQCRRAPAVRRDRFFPRVQASLLRQYAERRPQHSGRSRPGGVRGDRRRQRRQQPARTTDRRDRAEDLHRRLHRLHDPAVHRLDHRVPLLQDQPGGADGWCRGCAFALGPVPRGGGGDREHGAVDRLPGGLCGVGRAAHDLRLLRDDPGAVTSSDTRGAK